MTKLQRTGLFLGPAVFLILLVASAAGLLHRDLKPEMVSVMATGALMAIWWMTEAIPIPATSLLPVALFPLLGVMPAKQATLPYANHIIYLFIGGFFIAIAIEKWNLHRRIALQTIRAVGSSPKRIILGFMVASAVLSMWVSNTATTMMMLPVGLAVVSQITSVLEKQGQEIDLKQFNFATALMLGIAYAASIGGVGTIIGSPPNTIMVGIVEQQFGQQIAFAQWMLFAIPISLCFLGICWYLLVVVFFPPEISTIPGGRQLIDSELSRLGPMGKEEKLVITVFAAVAISWITRGFLETSDVADSTIAIAGALALFLIPSDFKRGEFLLDWQNALRVPWGVVILFGGGLALTNGIQVVGLTHWLADQLQSLGNLNIILLTFVVVVFTIFLTEVTSNTATATLLMPIMGTLAVSMGLHPFGPMLATCVATSYAFMLPVATPPNAVVFGSGHVSIYQMSRIGLWLNLLGAILITAFSLLLLPLVWGIELGTLPNWIKP